MKRNLLLLLIGMVAGSCVSQAYAEVELKKHFNYSVVRCETLKGEGYVMVYLNDLTYKIDVVCK